jgi:glyoxylase-like metal-dependent hydrolase (beta-lactamase superfamily II)
MIRALHVGLLVQMLLIGRGEISEEYVRIERLSERVLLAYWLGTGRCNLTVIQSEKGLVIIDTEMSPRIMAPIKQRIEKEFGRSDWAYVINTHGHMHHTGGNGLFEGAVIVGHENLPMDMEWLVQKQTDPARRRMELELARQTLNNLSTVLPQVSRNRFQARRIRGEIEFWKRYIKDMEEGYEVVKPSITFGDRHVLDMGELRLELIFFGKGHSRSDTLVYIPQERLLVTGAIVYQRRHLPEIGEESELKDLNRFLTILDEFLAEGVKLDYVVPSHSPPLQQSDLRPVRNYYQKMLEEARLAQRKGLTLEQATELLSVRRKFPHFRVPPPGSWAYGMHERNLRNLWRILHEERNLKTKGAGN